MITSKLVATVLCSILISSILWAIPSVTFAESSPVHRFWSKDYKSHFFTVSETEKEKIISSDPNWRYEGVAYYVDKDNTNGESSPVHRFWSKDYKSHFFTVSETEKEKIISSDPNWRYEGVAYYVDKDNVDPTIPTIPTTPDTTIPTITLNGPITQTIVQGSSYAEYGAQARDDRDGNIDARIVVDSSNLDINTIGSYRVKYNVSDIAGNLAEETVRAVNVVAAFAFVEGKNTTAPSSSWSKPSLGGVYVDAAYGTTVRRMTSATGTRFNRNNYSRIQPENSGGTQFMTYHGDAKYHAYDTTSTQLIRATDIHPDGEPQWHPTDNDKTRHLDGPNSYVGSLKLYEYSISTGIRSTIADLTNSVVALMPSAVYMYDAAEGSPSKDGNRYAWMIDDGNESLIGVVSYDIQTQQILGSLTSLPTDRNNDFLNWVSVSPSGEYILASWSQGTESGTYMYDIDFTNEYKLTESSEHSDIGVGANGNDFYIYVDFATGSPDDGWVVSVDLVTKQKTRLFNLYDNANTSIHFSAKNFDKPGWALISTYNCHVNGAWSCYKIFAINVTSGRILNLAHTYNCGDQYWTETQASVNRDFTRVYYNSDAGSCGTDAEVYMIDVPPFS